MIFETIGMAMMGTSVAMGTHEVMKANKAKKKYKKEFRSNCNSAELFKSHKHKGKSYKQYPKVISVTIKPHKTTIIFNIPYGMNPENFSKKDYTFRQHFGKYIQLEMEDRRGILHIYPNGLPEKVTYNYDLVKESMTNMALPILCGQSLDNEIKSIDMVENPHILIAGETGSGKSSAIRSILTTLIQHLEPSRVKLYLGDLKRSEFFLFKHLPHVEGVYHSAEEIMTPLKKVKKEMIKRGNMLDKEEVNSIDQLKEKLPYLVVCIDEVVLLKKETDIMDILEEISSIGRSLGVFLILSMQRPDAKLLEGKLKVNMTVRMGFQTADAINARIIGTEGSELIETAGRMILKVNSNGEMIQCTWLDNEVAKGILKPFKVKPKEALKNEPQPPTEVINNEDSNIVDLELFRK